MDIKDAQKGKAVVVREGLCDKLSANPICPAQRRRRWVPRRRGSSCGRFQFSQEGGAKLMNATGVHGAVPHGVFVFEV